MGPLLVPWIIWKSGAICLTYDMPRRGYGIGPSTMQKDGVVYFADCLPRESIEGLLTKPWMSILKGWISSSFWIGLLKNVGDWESLWKPRKSI